MVALETGPASCARTTSRSSGRTRTPATGSSSAPWRSSAPRRLTRRLARQLRRVIAARSCDKSALGWRTAAGCGLWDVHVRDRWAASGKSEYALRRASELGPPPWLYVAPHIEGDDELQGAAGGHRRDQEADLEADRGARAAGACSSRPRSAGHGAVVIDRFTIWLSNRLARPEDRRRPRVLARGRELADQPLPLDDARGRS